MFLNALIIGGWLMIIGIFSLGFVIRDRINERRKKKISKEIWLMR